MPAVKRYVAVASVVLSGLVVPSGNLHAREDLANGWGPSALEIGKLPDYCQNYFQKKVLPPNCDGIHHLCAGKVLINRTMDISIPKPERQRILGHAKQEVAYIFGRDNQSCPSKFMDEARATQRSIRIVEPFVR